MNMKSYDRDAWSALTPQTRQQLRWQYRISRRVLAMDRLTARWCVNTSIWAIHTERVYGS